MEITGRITADATVKKLTDGRQLVAFSLAVNDSYKPKGDDKQVKLTTYINCAYWITTAVAQYIKRGGVISVYGNMNLNIWKDQQGEPKGSINFHVNNIRFVAKPNNSSSQDNVFSAKAKAEDGIATAGDDLPF